jgi:hypothetical protein
MASVPPPSGASNDSRLARRRLPRFSATGGDFFAPGEQVGMETRTPEWISDDGRIRLYLGDSREVLPLVGHIDAVAADPPYGVNLGSHGAAKDRRVNRVLVKDGYDGYDDTPENFDRVVVSIVNWATANVGRSAVFCPVPSAWRLPTPDALGGVYMPSGCGRSKWGFTCFSPIWLYGQAPELQRGAYPTTYRSTSRAEKNGHPCPKPLDWMEWLVGLVSRGNETVCDPFMGSGTTGVACVKLGRQFVGIECHRPYFDLAVSKIQRAIAEKAELLPLGAHLKAPGE